MSKTITAKRHVLQMDIPDNWLITLPGLFGRLFGTVVDFDCPELGIGCNIVEGSSRAYETAEKNETFFRSQYPASSITEVSRIRVNGSSHFTAVYGKGGMIHKRYAIIHDGREYAIVCSSARYDEKEFLGKVAPVCDGIVTSIHFSVRQ